MNEEETFEALREILPELETKLRVSIQGECRLQINRIQSYYQKLTSETIAQKEKEYQEEMERNQTQLRKQLSIIQRERQQWLALENNYRKTIFQLTQRLKQNKGSTNISALTQITPKNNPQVQKFEIEQKVGGWKKKNKKEDIFSKNTKTDSKIIGFQDLCQSQIGFQKNGDNYFQQKEEDNLLQERPLKLTESSDSKFKHKKATNKMPNEQEFKERSQRQDTMVLSPPKEQDRVIMRSSFIDPPNSNTIKGSILKNQEGKKKLLELIRNIK